MKESEIKNLIVEPTNKDVLVGKEFFCQENPGNEDFRTLITRHAPEYEQARNQDGVKSRAANAIKERILAQIAANGGRFLIRVKEEGAVTGERKSLKELQWTEMSHTGALSRVVVAFRRKRERKSEGATPASDEEDSATEPEQFGGGTEGDQHSQNEERFEHHGSVTAQNQLLQLKREAQVSPSDSGCVGNSATTVECMELDSPTQATANTALDPDYYPTELTFTGIFNALHIRLHDDDVKRIVRTFGDDLCGVQEFLVFFNENPDRAMREYKVTEWVYQKRLRILSTWFEMVYEPAPDDEKPSLDRKAWVNFLKRLAASNRKMGINRNTRGVESITSSLSMSTLSTSEEERLWRDLRNKHLGEKKRTRDPRSSGPESSSSRRSGPQQKSPRV